MPATSQQLTSPCRWLLHDPPLNLLISPPLLFECLRRGELRCLVFSSVLRFWTCYIEIHNAQYSEKEPTAGSFEKLFPILGSLLCLPNRPLVEGFVESVLCLKAFLQLTTKSCLHCFLSDSSFSHPAVVNTEVAWCHKWRTLSYSPTLECEDLGWGPGTFCHRTSPSSWESVGQEISSWYFVPALQFTNHQHSLYDTKLTNKTLDGGFIYKLQILGGSINW